MNYATKGKNRVISFFLSQPQRSFSTDEIESALSDIPESTLYRILSSLAKEGVITRVSNRERQYKYQYQDGGHCMEHMHLRCVSCGRIEHLDEKATKDIERIAEESGFTARNTTYIEGICRDCREKGKF